jgi:hypothetical protein
MSCGRVRSTASRHRLPFEDERLWLLSEPLPQDSSFTSGSRS